jgi:hypothetical protein
MKKFYLFIIFFWEIFITPSGLLSQTDSLLNIINDLAEDETFYTELLLDLKEQPLNINFANKDDFLALPLITSEIADTIIGHRRLYGDYKYIRQLRKIIGPEIYDLVKPYLTASDKGYNNLHFIHRDIYKIEKIKEIENGTYRGNALNNYNRLKYQYNPNLNFGIVTQKDPGENSYTDHFSYVLNYKTRKWNIILGNFYLQFAEGLSHSNPYGNQKSTFIQAVFRETSSFARPNLTSAELSGKYGFFLQRDWDGYSVFTFYSNAQRDAQTNGDYITGIKFDGLHRSESELSSKAKLREQNSGGGFKIDPTGFLTISGILNQYQFSDFISNSEGVIGENQKRRQYYSFSGKHLNQAGLHSVFKINYFRLSSEISSSDPGKPGWSQSLFYSNEAFKAGLKYWNLDKNFQTIDGRSFDTSTPFPNGLKGFFAGAQLRIARGSTIYAYKTAQQRTWRSYFDPMPTAKNEWLVQWDSKISNAGFTIRIRHKNGEEYKDSGMGSKLDEYTQNNYRLQVDYKVSGNIFTRTRWEHTLLANSPEQGTLFFQEFNYSYKPNITLSNRLTFFNTSSFTSRIYEFERDLPGTFSNIALFDNGHKFYSIINWEATEYLAVWLKLRYAVKTNTLPNGTYNKSLDRDIRFQLNYSF